MLAKFTFLIVCCLVSSSSIAIVEKDIPDKIEQEEVSYSTTQESKSQSSTHNQHGESFSSPNPIISDHRTSNSEQNTKPHPDISLKVANTAALNGSDPLAAKDLVQQTRMADATETIVRYTCWQIIIGMVGLIMLGWTLWETRRATKAAISAVKQNRAWVSHIGNRINNPINWTCGNNVEYTWINEGATYALDFLFGYEIGKDITKFSYTGDREYVGILRATDTYTGKIIIPDDVIDAIYNNKEQYFLFTYIKYKTVHGDDCITKRIDEIILDYDVTISFTKPRLIKLISIEQTIT